MLDRTDDESQETDTSIAGFHLPDEDQVAKLKRFVSSNNIAEEDDITNEKLSNIGQLVTREYEIDKNTLNEWREQAEKADKIANQVAERKQYPWPGSSSILYPLITTAAIQFAARAYPAIVSGRNVVKGTIIGNDEGTPLVVNGQPIPDPSSPGQPIWLVPPGAKRSRADRIGDHMSFQLLDEQTEWESETDKLLHVLPILGTAFRKIYFDSDKGHNAAVYISALDLVINYHARSLERAPRITEEIFFYPLEIEEKERSGIFRHIEYTSSPESDGDVDAPIAFLEQHRWLDLDDDGYREPYIVTICKATSEVVRIVSRYEIEGIHYNHTKGHIQRIDPIHYYELYQFLPNFEIKGSIYGTGFGRLLLPINESINTTLNMLIDAGHLANTQGGFIGKGLSMNAGSLRFRPGEYKTVNASGQTIRDSIFQMQFPGPSPVLFQLLGMLVESGREIASIKDILSGENQNANTPATTTLAIIEQGLKTFTSIYKRIYRSLKGEFGKLYRLNKIYLNEESSYKVGNDWKNITKADYSEGSGVEPVADPNVVTDMQKLGRAQFLLQFANDTAMDGHEIRRRVLEAAGIEQIDKLFNANQQPNPMIIAKTAELSIRQTEAEASAELKRAQALLARASAITQFSIADKNVGDVHIAWIQQQLEALRMAMEQSTQSPAPDVLGQSGNLPGAPMGHIPAHTNIPLPAGAAPPISEAALSSPGAYLAQARQGNLPG